MGDTELSLWLNIHRLEVLDNALNEQGTSAEKTLQNYLIELYTDTVPLDIQQQVDKRIESERLAAEKTAEESRKLTVFHVSEQGQEHYLETDFGMDMLQLAQLLRQYLRTPKDAQTGFVEQIRCRLTSIDSDVFMERVSQRMENTGKIIGVFDLDFDKNEFSAVNIMDGWKTFSMQDISVAAYRAYRKAHMNYEKRWTIFVNEFEGKELECLRPSRDLEMGM